ncbi:SH3 beta-barrel fold-containing protein [Runella sp.]|uniref:SH3 beta-barrel fold-containing protein n=1 Tax=Runella sp. TaxID=1960881 RepID=UPI003D0EF77A
MKNVSKLQKALGNGQTVLIEFEKVNGDPRRAWVTRNPDLIPAEKHPKNASKSKKSKLIVLFDTVKGDWISCYGDKITLVKTPPTPSQIRRKEERKNRWALVEKIRSAYHFTVSEALKIACGQTVDKCNLLNLSL